MFKWRGLFNSGYLLVIIALIILVNIVFSLLNFKIDLTADQRYSLSKGSELFLGKIKKQDNRINLKIYLEGDLPAEIQGFRNAIEDKLKDFKSIAGNRIEYEFINPNAGHASKKEELFFLKGIFDKGILPTRVVFVKNGVQSQLLLWAGAEITCTSNGVVKESYVQFLPGTPNGAPLELGKINPIIENSINNLEYNLLSAMRKISQSEKKRIAFLQGHGELKDQETIIARSILSPYFYLSSLTLGSKSSYEELNRLDGIVIADPKNTFSDIDLYFIDQFVMNGGRLMVFLNTLDHNEDSLTKNSLEHTTRKNLKLDKMLFDYGIRVHENYVYDRICGYRSIQSNKISSLSWPYYVMSSPSKHPITRNIDPVNIPYPNELQLIEKPGVKLNKILTSSSNANRSGIAPQISLMDFQIFGENPAFIGNPDDPLNKITLAAMAEGRIPSYFTNRELADESNRSIAQTEEMNQVPKKFRTKKLKSSPSAKVFVVGNGSFIANGYDSIAKGESYQYRPFPAGFNPLKFGKTPDINGKPLIFGNQEFLQNMVDYMLGDNSVLDIRSRQIELRQLDSRKLLAEIKFLKYLNLIIPTLLITSIGIVIYVIRRKKYK
jgi:gliding-associated putative ABC transporter substrate-binding component GldG